MYPTEVIINYDILRENFRNLQAYEKQATLLPVIKSDAYGHGLIPTAHAMLEGGAKLLGVFRVAEALRLRANGFSCPIWVLMGALPEEAESVATQSLTLATFNLEQAQALSQAGVKAGTCIHLHLAIDTGMGRLGFTPDQLPEALKAIQALPGVKVTGIVSHIAQSSDPNHPVTQKQVANFRAALQLLPKDCTENHLCASQAWLSRLCPELPYARPGIVLYTEQKYPGMKESLTQDAMTLKSKLISLKKLPKGHTISYGCTHTLERDSLVGVIPVGYDDGYPRPLSNKAQVLIHGKRVPILGRVCMSMIMIDVTDIPGVALGDEVVLIGRQGNEKITIYELTTLVSHIEQEIVCAIGRNAQFLQLI